VGDTIFIRKVGQNLMVVKHEVSYVNAEQDFFVFCNPSVVLFDNLSNCVCL